MSNEFGNTHATVPHDSLVSEAAVFYNGTILMKRWALKCRSGMRYGTKTITTANTGDNWLVGACFGIVFHCE